MSESDQSSGPAPPPNPFRIVVVDDDRAARMSMGQMLRLRKHEVEVFDSAETALAWPGILDVDCVLSDVKMPGMDGEQFLAALMSMPQPPPVIMITGHGDVAMAVRCLKTGAYDFVEKPYDEEVLLAAVSRAVEKSRLRRESRDLKRRLASLSEKEDGRYGMVGTSTAMTDMYEQIAVLSRSDAPVLILGETGAGKELVAKALHDSSGRADKPFVAVNAGALPESMMESELFGHARGAFTGAGEEREGKLVAASGGTLLLDEVESISLRAQVQLLRVLEDGLVTALGKDEPRQVDVRLLATAKVDLKEEVRQGRMREDFYHRIMVLSVTVPALRERPEDIPALISHFGRRLVDRYGIAMPDIPESTLSTMLTYAWPGNVRELKNAVERMVMTAQGGVAGPFEADDSLESGRLLSIPVTAGKLRVELERMERTVIDAVLREHQGEINATSRALGISRRALYERMKKYELRKEEYKK